MTELRDRIMAKVRHDAGGCWTWTGANDGTDGYGRIVIDGKQRAAHRVSYIEHIGPIPEGLVIDHLCRNRACVNPDHLQPVTTGENIRRGETGGKVLAICQRGHTMSETRRTRPSGSTYCGQCDREKRQRRKAQ